MELPVIKKKKEPTGEQEASIEVIRRHLRRRARVQWMNDEPTVGEVQIMNWVWTVEVCVVTVENGFHEPGDAPVDKYQATLSLRMPDRGADRSYTVRCRDSYGLTHQYVSIQSLVELIERNDLSQDEF